MIYLSESSTAALIAAVVLPSVDPEVVLQAEHFAEGLVYIEAVLPCTTAADVLGTADIDGGRGVVAECRHAVAVAGIKGDAGTE